MKTKHLTLTLAIVAGLLCFGAFISRTIKSGTADYTILAAGFFIIALGITAWFRKK
jgi:hypothetical protein